MIVAFACGVSIGQVRPFYAVRPGAQRVLWSVLARAKPVAEPTLRNVDPCANAIMAMSVAILG